MRVKLKDWFFCQDILKLVEENKRLEHENKVCLDDMWVIPLEGRNWVYQATQLLTRPNGVRLNVVMDGKVDSYGGMMTTWEDVFKTGWLVYRSE